MDMVKVWYGYVIYQTRKDVFGHISKHPEGVWPVWK